MPLRPLGKKVVGKLIVPGINSPILQPFAEEKRTYAMKVLSVGDGCKEVQIGDVVILPESGWVRVTLLEGDETVDAVSIREDLLLAVVD